MACPAGLLLEKMRSCLELFFSSQQNIQQSTSPYQGNMEFTLCDIVVVEIWKRSLGRFSPLYVLSKATSLMGTCFKTASRKDWTFTKQKLFLQCKNASLAKELFQLDNLKCLAKYIFVFNWTLTCRLLLDLPLIEKCKKYEIHFTGKTTKFQKNFDIFKSWAARLGFNQKPPLVLQAKIRLFHAWNNHETDFIFPAILHAVCGL